jgi:hypothetical protein
LEFFADRNLKNERRWLGPPPLLLSAFAVFRLNPQASFEFGKLLDGIVSGKIGVAALVLGRDVPRS